MQGSNTNLNKVVEMKSWHRSLIVAVMIVLLVSLGSIIVPTQRSQAMRTDNLAASQDALIDPNNPSTNYGGERLEVTYSNFPTFAPTRRSLLQFDLSTTTESLTSAVLTLELVESNLVAGSQVNLALYAADDGWAESSVTWNNQPAKGELLQTVSIAAGFLGPVQFNATAVSNDLEAARMGDGRASFLLVLDSGSGSLGFGGNLVFENREGVHDGINGNEPFITMPTTTTVTPTSSTTPDQTATAMPTPSVTVTVIGAATATVTPTATSTVTLTATPNGTASPELFLPLITK